MKNRIITILLLSFVSLVGNAQQDAQYTQFMSNKLVINPAYAGSRDAISVTALYRHQWLGLDGAPRTSTLSMNAPINKMNSGVGLSLIYDRIGLSEIWFVDMAYAYRLRLDDKNWLNIGATARLEHFGVRWDEADPINPGDIDIPDDSPNRVMPDFGIGVYYHNPHFYAGLSVPHLLKNELYLDTRNNPNAGQYYANQRHVYLMTGGVVRLNDKVKMRPAALFKYQRESPFDMDLNLSFVLVDALWLGGSYRLGDSVDGIVQYQFSPQLKVGLAYDYPISDLRRVTPGGFEVMVDYLFKYENDQTINIRYF